MDGYEAEPLLTDDEYSNMLDRGQQIAQLAGSPEFALWVDRANKDRFSRQLKVIQGGCKSYEEYLSDVAWLQGVAFALEGIPVAVDAEIAEYRLRLEEQKAE